MRIRTLLAMLFAGVLLFLGMGCYETQYPLGSADKAVVNTAYVGDFVMTENNKTETIIIRNIDDQTYYVEYDSEDKPDRMIGYTSDVNGVTFANLRTLTDDGSIDTHYLIMRVAISPDRGKFTLRNLKDDFFKTRQINSSDDLQKIIAANLDNEQMYDGPAVEATRVTAPPAPANNRATHPTL
jgi:hypothetical protein